MVRRLKRNFFLQPTLKVAKQMLGKHLIHKVSNKKIIGKIVETEAYLGPQDKASHGYRWRRTPRNRAEYMVGGHIYIYLVYGMYWQLNLSTGPEGRPECVLIRAVEPTSEKIPNHKFQFPKKFQISNSKIKKLSNGPGKLCQYLKLSGRQYGTDVCNSKEVWLEDRGEEIKPSQIIASKRNGIDNAGKYWANKKWRFYIKNNSFVSKK